MQNCVRSEKLATNGASRNFDPRFERDVLFYTAILRFPLLESILAAKSANPWNFKHLNRVFREIFFSPEILAQIHFRWSKQR